MLAVWLTVRKASTGSDVEDVNGFAGRCAFVGSGPARPPPPFPVHSRLPNFINLLVPWQTDGVVAIVLPDGHIVSTLLPTSTPEVVARLHVTVFPADEEFLANLLCVVAEPSAALPQPGGSTLHCHAARFLLRQDVPPFEGEMVFDVEGISEAPFDLFKPDRSRMGVPYHPGAEKAARKATAENPLPQGVWACRFGEEGRAYENDVDPGARHATGPLSLTSTVAKNRKGHRRAALDRAEGAPSSAVTSFSHSMCAAY